MPIIREDRQYKIGPIGVARAYEGNLTGQAIARGADQMAGYFFDIAAENAQQKGVELAQSIDRDELLTIDPATGAPAALGRVEDMGRVASQAYTRVLQDRYRQSIEEEIRNQATILAGQYENSGNGVALYQTAMSDYIAEMSNNATGIYRGYIEDFGTSYINSTSASMTVNQLRRARSEMADGVTRSHQESLESVLGWYAQNGPESDGAPSLGSAMIESAQLNVDDATMAGILRENAPANATRELAVYRTAGIIQNYVNNSNLSSVEIAALNGAIGSQDISAIRRISPELADYIEPIASDYAAFSSLEPITSSFLSDRASVAEFDERQAIQLAMQQDSQRSFQLSTTNSYFGAITSDETFARFNASGTAGMVAFDTTMQSLTSNYNALGSAAASANERTSEALLARRSELVNANVDGILRYLLRDGATQERIDYLQAALGRSGESVPVDRADRSAIRTLRAIDALVEEDVLDAVSVDLGQYRDRESKYFDSVEQRQAMDLFEETIQPQFIELRDSRGNGTEQLFNEVMTALGDSGLTGTDLENAQKNANSHAMAARLNEMFSNDTLTETQISEAGKYLRGEDIDDTILPRYYRDLLDDARNYWNQSTQQSALRTEFNERAQGWREAQRIEQRNVERQQLQFDVANGLADGSLQESRQAANDLLSTQYRAAFGEDLPNDFFTNPAYVQDQRFAEMFRTAYGMTSALPESAFNAFRAVASGAVGPNIDIETVMTHWDQISMHEIDGGAKVIRSPAVNALSERDIAVLDYVSSAINITGASSDDINQAIIGAQRVFRDPNYTENVRAFLGSDYSSLEDYFAQEVSGYTDLSLEDRRSIRARFDAIYSVASVLDRPPSDIATELTRQVERSFPEGDGIVIAFTPDGRMTNRTRYALSAVMPNDVQVFKEHVLAGISELAPSVEARFAPQSLFSEVSSTFSGLGAVMPTMTNLVSRATASGDYVVLAPVGPQVGNETIYGVYKFNADTSQFTLVPREDEGFEGVPLMFSSAELRNAQINASDTSIMRRNQLFRWARTGTEYEGLYDMFDGQVNTDLLLQEN